MDGTMTTHEKSDALQTKGPRRWQDRTTLACLVLLAAVLTALLGGSSSAYAGEWMQVSCVNPNQSAAGNAGWSSFAAGGGYASNNGTSCGPGSPMYGVLSTDAAVSVGSIETLQYTPPTGSTLIGGSIDVSLYADGYGADASGTAVAYTPEYAYNGSNVFFQCASGLTPCSTGSNDYSGVLGVPAGRGGDLYLSAGCGGVSGQSCNAGGSNGAWSRVQLWWANLLLSDNASPAASGVGGTLLDPGARGTQDLTFTAADPGGPGVYSVTAQVDGQTLYSGTPNENGGTCVPVGSTGGALMFDASQPCKQTEAVDLPINTTSLADGQHTLKLTVEDAAQNSSVVYDGTITTSNAPADTSAPAVLAPGQVFAGAALAAQPGAWSAPSGAGATTYSYQWQDCNTEGNNCAAVAGAQSASYTPAPTDVGHALRVLVTAADSDGATSTASAATSAVLSSESSLGASPGPGTGAPATAVSDIPNGMGASENAQLHLGVAHAIARPFARRAFKLTGRLLASDGDPITGASLEVTQQIAGAGTPLVIGRASTNSSGAFTLEIPAGPSRLVQVLYRAFSADAGYAAQATVHEAVGAGVRLEIAPRYVSSTGTIVLSGRVLGSVPSQGLVVEMLVHYRGRWEPFRDPRTDAAGHFQVVYQFEGGTGRFPFRAEILGGQAGFPYSHGESGAVDVRTD
jgi:hypothetical protein